LCRYGEFIATAIEGRLKDHDFEKCFFSASISDSGANCVVAKGYLTPDDAEPCFNHNLKHVIDDVFGSETGGGSFHLGINDLKAMSLLIAHIRGASVVRTAFAACARDLEEPDLEFIQANLTRWEGRVSALQRFLLLKNQLQALRKTVLVPFLGQVQV
jgi:hypothetical protein